MNYFHQYNNATVVLNNEFIFDPWLYGSLYYNSWSPEKKALKKEKLKNIKYCFISHLHQDHWDLDTIKYFPKKHGHGNLQNLGDVKVFSNSNVYHFKCNDNLSKSIVEYLSKNKHYTNIYYPLNNDYNNVHITEEYNIYYSNNKYKIQNKITGKNLALRNDKLVFDTKNNFIWNLIPIETFYNVSNTDYNT